MRTGKYTLDPSLRAVLLDLGVRPSNVLRRAGLPPNLLSNGPTWLDQPQFFALWRAIEVESGDPNLPLRIEDVFAPEVFAPPIFAALMSRDLNTAATRVATYKTLIGPMTLHVDISTDETSIGCSFPDGDTPPNNLVLSELLFWVQMARTATRHRVVPAQVTTPRPPADRAAYADFLGVEIITGSRAQVQFGAVDAARPFLTANEAIWETFEPELRRRLSELEGDASTTEQVRGTLLELLPTGHTTMADVAGELAMSSRTLHRRLARDNTTYQRILDQTREDLARHYLANPNLSAAEISFLLGYEETTSFYRAFSQWTGETPERVRATLVRAK
ncbi:MAG: AraC family transcriptional regulator ligand-binding domain-containing protein [Actinomycetota bacterium]